MSGKTLLYFFSFLSTISRCLATGCFSDTDIIAGNVYNFYSGYDVTEENTYSKDQRRGFCILLTMGDCSLFPKSDLVQGDFHKDLLEVGYSINIYAVKCTEKYNDDVELWIGKGPTSGTVAVYTKSADDTGEFIGAMENVDDTQLPPQ